MFRSGKVRPVKKHAIGIGVFVVALAVMGSIVTHNNGSTGISSFREKSADTEAFIHSAEHAGKTRDAFVNYTMFTIKYLKAAEYSLEEKWLFLHYYKTVGDTYVATMRKLEVSDKGIKDDLNHMLSQMLDASEKIRGQVNDIIPGFVFASTRWYQKMGLGQEQNRSRVVWD